MYTHFQHWKWFLESRLLLRELSDQDEFIFPTVGSNGVIYPKQEMSYDVVQECINEFREKSGVTGQLTTHSFHRGGAQYRFMHAPTGQRWTLSRIRWWGGWAKGEQVSCISPVMIKTNPCKQIDTLIRYLLDSAQNEETNHSNALYPIQQEANQHQLIRPLSMQEFHTELRMIIKKDIADTISSTLAGAIPNGM